MDSCVFCKIASKEIQKDFSYQDADIMVFPDLHPIKPVHLLVIPKKHFREFSVVEDPQIFAKLSLVIQKMINEFELQDKGYRIVVNGGGAQEIHHFHIHLLGPMGAKIAM